MLGLDLDDHSGLLGPGSASVAPGPSGRFQVAWADCNGDADHRWVSVDVDGRPDHHSGPCSCSPGAIRVTTRAGLSACVGNGHIRLSLPHSGPAIDPLVQRHALTNVIVPLAASMGATVLHGAVVTRNGRALVLAAPTGTGKSTLAAAAMDHGFDVLCDDTAAVTPAPGTGWLVHPGVGEIRARRPDGRTRDHVTLDVAGTPVELRAIAVVHRAVHSRWVVLRPATAHQELLRNSFVFDRTPEGLRRWSRRVGAISRSVPVGRLDVAGGLPIDPGIAEILAERIDQGPGGDRP